MECSGREPERSSNPAPPWAGHLPPGQGEDPGKNFLLDDGTEEGEAPKEPKNLIPEERNP